MPEIFTDTGLCLYMPDTLTHHTPYWKAFMVLAVETKTMEVSEEDINKVAFFNEREEIRGIQVPDPVDDEGAPVEESVNFLLAFLDPEHVQEIVDHVHVLKKEKGIAHSELTSQFMEIVGGLDMDQEEC